MLSLLTRRVTLSAHRSTAIYTRILPTPASTLRARAITGGRFHTSTVRTFENPRRNASTKATATTKKTKASTKSTTTGKVGNLTPEQKAAQKQALQAKKELEKKKKALDVKKKAERAAALRAKQKAQAEKKKVAAAQKRKRLAEKRKELDKAKKEKERERQKAREAKKPKIINPPPRRMSAYALFVQEAKKPLQEVTNDWRKLSEEKKQEYTTRAKAMADKRKEEFDTFVKTLTPLDIRLYNRHRRDGAPVIRVKLGGDRPLSPYIRWYAQVFRMRPDQAGKKTSEVTKAAGEAWHSLTRAEKDLYKFKPTESTSAQEHPKVSEPSDPSSHSLL